MKKREKRFADIASEEKARKMASWLEDKKAEDVVVMDVQGQSPITEFVVLATAGSPRHAKGLASHVLDMMGEENFEYLGMEGQDEGHWVLVDCNDVLVNIFMGEHRAQFNLEGLWAEARRISRE
ncbi:MAG: ribosome silencing factor [Desulfovibrio sp.]|uniref:ribosome silencing factor n=1 Tax=Desulfovibrio sp. 7SRBS1 TaxID=3378064 RepID=UPI003B3F3678